LSAEDTIHVSSLSSQVDFALIANGHRHRDAVAHGPCSKVYIERGFVARDPVSQAAGTAALKTIANFVFGISRGAFNFVHGLALIRQGENR
jgi:hypothetical protein